MSTIKVGGREFALEFTLYAMGEMEKSIGIKIDLNTLKETLIDQLKDVHGFVKILRVLAAEGEALEGRELDLDEAWFARRIRPGALPSLQISVLECIASGMAMETAAADDGPVDEVLEELKKNQIPSPEET